MYKRIKAGHNLRITGEGLYLGADTFVYFNSVSTENEAEIVPDSFNPSGTELQIRIPETLPNKFNTIIIENEIGQFQGTQQYEFVGRPQISTITPNPQYWNQVFAIEGDYFYNTTGVSIGGTNATEYWAEGGGERIQVKMPIDIIAGEHQVSVKTEIGEDLGSMQVLEPSVYGELALKSYTDGLRYGESVELEDGQALHRVNRVVVSGLSGPINSDSPTRYGSVGLSFPLPQGTMDGYSVKLQEQSGVLVSGIFQPNVIQEHTTENKVKVNSPYIRHISTGVGKYQDPIRIDGVNLHSCKILFKGYGSTNVEAPVLSSGETFVNVSVPKNIIEGKITASGESGVYGTYSSTQAFYPLPTIASMSTTEWVIGEEMQIEAINASQMARTIAISGTHAQTDEQSLFFVSNSVADQGANYHGRITFDNSSLIDSVETGVTRVTALINSVFLGSGTPFLIASQELAHEGPQTYLQKLQNSSTLNRYHDLTGQGVTIAGKQPTVLGVEKVRTTNTDTIFISGKYLMSATGLGLSGDGENYVLAKENWEDIRGSTYDPKLRMTLAEGDANIYEATHIMKVDLSRIMFSGAHGEFYFLA